MAYEGGVKDLQEALVGNFSRDMTRAARCCLEPTTAPGSKRLGKGTYGEVWQCSDEGYVMKDLKFQFTPEALREEVRLGKMMQKWHLAPGVEACRDIVDSDRLVAGSDTEDRVNRRIVMQNLSDISVSAQDLLYELCPTKMVRMFRKKSAADWEKIKYIIGQNFAGSAHDIEACFNQLEDRASNGAFDPVEPGGREGHTPVNFAEAVVDNFRMAEHDGVVRQRMILLVSVVFVEYVRSLVRAFLRAGEKLDEERVALLDCTPNNSYFVYRGCNWTALAHLTERICTIAGGDSGAAGEIMRRVFDSRLNRELGVAPLFAHRMVLIDFDPHMNVKILGNEHPGSLLPGAHSRAYLCLLWATYSQPMHFFQQQLYYYNPPLSELDMKLDYLENPTGQCRSLLWYLIAPEAHSRKPAERVEKLVEVIDKNKMQNSLEVFSALYFLLHYSNYEQRDQMEPMWSMVPRASVLPRARDRYDDRNQPEHRPGLVNALMQIAASIYGIDRGLM